MKTNAINVGLLAGKRLSAYARYSTDHQDPTSIEDQLRSCETFARRNGGEGEIRPFTDQAESGTTSARTDYQKLLTAVRNKEIDVILAEDLSRISRDSVQTEIFIRECRFNDVMVVTTSDGMVVTDRKNRVLAKFKAIMNEEAVEEIRYRTLRGQEGRVRAGYSAGGSLYGYRTRNVSKDPKSPRYEVYVYEPEAEIVREMFRLYDAGHSCSRIARILNERNIPSPRAHTRSRYRGWVATTVRSMLANRAFIGEWAFKRREWERVDIGGGVRKRRYKVRPDHEVMTHVYPERRIVDAELWERVRQRRDAVRAHFTGAGKSKGAFMGRRTPYLFSGIIRCANCGAPMSITGGSSKRYYGCNDHWKRGTCANSLSVREDVVRERLLAGLLERLAKPKWMKALRARVVVALKNGLSAGGSDLRRQRDLLGKEESALARLVAVIADGEDSEYIRSSIREREAKVRALRVTVAALEVQERAPSEVPSVDALLARATDLNRVLQASVTEGRERLRHLFRDGRIMLKPQKEGYYVAESSLLPDVILDPKFVGGANALAADGSTVRHHAMSARATGRRTRG